MAQVTYTGSGNVYENPRRISPGIQKLRIPIIDNDLTNAPNMFVAGYDSPIQEPTIRTLELNRYHCSLHISMDVLQNLLGVSSNSRDGVNVFIYEVSKVTQDRLSEMQPVNSGHPVIIDRVGLTEQVSTYSIVVNIDFWAVQHADADLGRAAFERTLHEGLSNMRVVGTSPAINPLPHLDPSTFHRGGYDVDAEENAHELLKGMLTKKQFALYKTEGYVAVKGTYGRTYKVNKNDMIDVVKKIKGSKASSYRLCIEPRDQGTICPTDEVIAKIKLIQSSEKELHKVGIKWTGNMNVTVLDWVNTAGYCTIREEYTSE